MATKWVRVKDKNTGHEFTVAERAVRGHHEVLANKDAVGRNGKPLSAKPKVKVGAAAATPATTSKKDTSGGSDK